MRRIFAAIFALIIIVTIAGAWWVNGTRDSIHIQLGSHPFPLVVGQDTLTVSLTRADGSPVDGATVRVEANRVMQGQLPLTGSSHRSEGGVYSIPMIWSSSDHWIVDVSAQLQNETIRDQFTVFVYAIPQENKGNRDRYQSLLAIETVRTTHPQEYWIVIPLGTNALIREGHGDDVMPGEIRLKVNGQNTLVIQNNDIADHSIGPYFVQAGETLRQTFAQPQVVEGLCSVRHDAVISIIVE